MRISLSLPGCALLAMCCLTACSPTVPMELDASRLQAAAANRSAVVSDLARYSGLSSVPAPNSSNWELVVLGGLDYIDQDLCEPFLESLFETDRRLRAARNQLADTAAAVGTVLAFTGTSLEAIGIVSAAFGLAQASIDNYQILRLVDLGPTRVRALVRRAQFAYREKIESRRNVYTHEIIAMNAVAGYLDLCRVPTIVSLIDRAIENTTFVADNTSRQSTPRLLAYGQREAPTPQINDSANSGQRGESGSFRRVPGTPDEPINGAPPPPTFIRRGITPYEQTIAFGDGQRLQQTLCVTPDGDFGPVDSDTRKTIAEAKRALRWLDGEITAAMVESKEVAQTLDSPAEFTAIRQGAQSPCVNNWSTFERYRFQDENEIKRLQNQLEIALLRVGVKDTSGANFEVPESGRFDEETRNAISEFQSVSSEASNTGKVDSVTFEEIRRIGQ